MVDFNPFNKYSNISPSNSMHQILLHPANNGRVIELGLFNHHRTAFYYWTKWKNEISKKNKPSEIDLISYDWHQDLAYPDEYTKKQLSEINLSNLFEVSFYSSYKLNPLNDNHIMAAVYLDILNNVWVLCRQGTFQNDWEDEYIDDCNGKQHIIRKFKTEEALKTAITKAKIESVFFDIDLDYFTLTNNLDMTQRLKYMKDINVRNLMSYDNDLIKWIFKRTDGITIALEPEYTGGITKSLKYLSMIEKLWFDKSLGNWDVNWRHIKDKDN